MTPVCIIAGQFKDFQADVLCAIPNNLDEDLRR